MTRYRVRVRFRKQGDLRWISHRDLARVFERTFRRAALPLSMSEGFHPKPRISFPSALALGIEGTDEVMEFELSEILAAEMLLQRIAEQAPPGLEIICVKAIEPGNGKAKLHRVTYEMAVPAERQETVEERIRQITEQANCPIQREGRVEPIDLKATLDKLEFCGGVVRFRLFADRAGSVRPREVLQAIGVDSLEQEGYCLKRSRVEIAS